MISAYELGYTRGYRGDPRNNPYRKGWRIDHFASLSILRWADDYDRGWFAGYKGAYQDQIDPKIKNPTMMPG